MLHNAAFHLDLHCLQKNLFQDIQYTELSDELVLLKKPINAGSRNPTYMYSTFWGATLNFVGISENFSI